MNVINGFIHQWNVLRCLKQKDSARVGAQYGDWGYVWRLCLALPRLPESACGSDRFLVEGTLRHSAASPAAAYQKEVPPRPPQLEVQWPQLELSLFTGR